MELPGRRKRKRPKWRFINVVRASMRTVGVLEGDADDWRVWKLIPRCDGLLRKKWRRKKSTSSSFGVLLTSA